MPRSYRFVAAADADVEDIYRYKLNIWDQVQADKYNDGIHAKCESVAERPSLGRKRPEFGREIQSIKYEAHSIYYRVTAGQIEILAVLHDAQDAEATLKPRMEKF